MIITLEETKGYLRVDNTEDDVLITSLIDASKAYLVNATGNAFDDTNNLARLFCLTLITDWYENRELDAGQVSSNVRPIIASILAQLKHCYQGPEVEE